MRILFALALVAALVLPVAAGDGGCGKGKCGGKTGGYPCKNACPLAEEANGLRSFGTEAESTSEKMREDSGNAVEESLGRI